MPYSVRSKRKRRSVPLKRKRYKARTGGITTGRIGTRASLTRNVGLPFPTKWRRKLNYVEKITLNPGAAGTTAANIFRANSLFDPNQTGVGHQPLGFDELMTAYKKYTVLGCRISATANANALNDDPVILGIEISETGGISADVTTILERGRATWKVMAANGGSPSVVTVVNKCDVAKYLGVKDVVDDVDLSGTSGTTPIRPLYAKIFAADSGSDDPATIEVLVCMEFDVVFHEPNTLNQS